VPKIIEIRKCSFKLQLKMSGVFLRHSVFVSKLWWDDYHPMDSRYWQRSKLLYPTHRVTERCEWPLDSKQVILNVSLAGSRIRLHTRCDKTISSLFNSLRDVPPTLCPLLFILYTTPRLVMSFHLSIWITIYI